MENLKAVTGVIDPPSNLGLIGLGSIGIHIAKNLSSFGYNLKVHTRSRNANKYKALANSKGCDYPYEVGVNSDAILICVTDCQAVESVIFGKHGVIDSISKGSIIIDCSTISPDKSRSIHKRLFNSGIGYLDCPVTGGTEAAESGNLTLFVGGDVNQLKRVSTILGVIGKKIVHFGEVGKGQEVKAINQILVAGNCIALAEATALGEKLNLPMKKVLRTLQTGAADSWVVRNRSTNMLNNYYPLGFKISLHKKDLDIAIDLANSLGLDIDITDKIRKIEEKLIKKGFQDEDISALKRHLI